MYIAEREDKDIIETDKGFATFKTFENGECYLQDLYVTPDYRKTGLATEMADRVVEIAKERGCDTLVGTIASNDKNSTRNMKVFLGYGMEISTVTDSMIFLRKRIK